MASAVMRGALLGAAVVGLALAALWPEAPAPARGRVADPVNLEAGVPPMCYTATGGTSNPCWVCHTSTHGQNFKGDWDLQREYAFSDEAMTNHWTNLFEDWSDETAAISDAEILAWIRTDNLSALGVGPDFEAGFDEEGFARDGSDWRAIRYKPFPGAFWPTNGSTDDTLVRLPPSMRRTRAEHLANLAILELAVAREGEPLPATYSDGTPVRRDLYPEGTEFLHSVRYIDPDAPDLRSHRVKELRYSRKVRDLDDWAIVRAYEREHDEKDEGKLPRFAGSPEVGLVSDLGWQLQGWIEDPSGRLRLQTDEEHRACMGCHGGIGVTVDSTFAFPRKVPGAAGWRLQDLRGMPDAPMLGHTAGEVLTYFRRVGAGDELRANDELLGRFWAAGVLDEDALRGRDLAWIFTPSRARALALNKAYLALVKTGRFNRGRDAVLAPARNVHRRIENAVTELQVFRDARLKLAW